MIIFEGANEHNYSLINKYIWKIIEIFLANFFIKTKYIFNNEFIKSKKKIRRNENIYSFAKCNNWYVWTKYT